MKRLILIAIFITSFAHASEEQDYFNEINKAFDRFYEATNDTNLSQRVNALKKLSSEYEDNEAVYDVLLVEQANAHSFIGRHHQALVAFDKRNRIPESLHQPVKSLDLKDAVSVIVKSAAERQIIMINEAHHIAQHRALTFQLLDGLWEQGYRYLALEGLAEDAEASIEESGYVPISAGYFVQEPVFANLLVHAQQLGFELVSYDYGFEISSPPEIREQRGADNLRKKIFDDSPDAKVVIHVGYGHINKTDRLAYYLKDSLNLEPLTINQTSISERSEMQFESETYTWLVENHPLDAPSILMDDNHELWSMHPEQFDAHVIWPRTRYILNRPDWARLGRELLPVNTKWCQNNFPCTVEVFERGKEGEAPTDRFVLHAETEETGVFISSSSSKVQIADIEGRILHTKLLN